MNPLTMLAVPIAAALVAAVPHAARATVPGVSLVHVVTQDGDESRIDHPALDGKPDALPLVTQVSLHGGLNLGGSPHEVGFYYEAGHWFVFQEDGTDIDAGTGFHVFVPDGVGFVHTVTPQNVNVFSSELPSTPTNEDPDALVFTTHRAGTDDVESPLSVRFNNGWEIQNSDQSVMFVGLEFHTLVLRDEPSAFVHVAPERETSFTLVDHPALNGRPDLTPIVTANWNPPGSPGVYNDATIAVRYDDELLGWRIFNTDGTSVPVGAAFNVLIAPEAGMAPALAMALALLTALRARKSAA